MTPDIQKHWAPVRGASKQWRIGRERKSERGKALQEVPSISKCTVGSAEANQKGGCALQLPCVWGSIICVFLSIVIRKLRGACIRLDLGKFSIYK